MFERYTEKARRVIFFARYEASQLGSPYIEPEHLLLGMLREDRAVWLLVSKQPIDSDAIKAEIATRAPSTLKIETSVDLPLSHQAKRLLAYGAEEAERLSHKHIGTPHLLLGLMREPSLAAEIIYRSGISLEAARTQVLLSEPARVPTSLRNSQIVEQLRREFAPLSAQLTPEIEPAVTYQP